MVATKGLFKSSLAAACATLGVAATPSIATEVDTAALVYAELDRVSAIETVVAVKHDFGAGRLFNFKLVLDSLTGASANGAVPRSDVLQIFTRPSGEGSFTVQPGETPLDDTFKDSRKALSIGYTMPFNRVTKMDFGLYGSGEHDYSSLGGNVSLSRDFDKRNRTLTAALSMSSDSVSPEGGRPIPFESMLPAGLDPLRLDGDGTKTVLDGILSLSQVINRSTVAQVNYSLSLADGYQTDPYKIVSVVDPTSGVPQDQLFEHRPDTRTKHILFALLKHHLAHDVVDLSYRFMTDDWGITSHTADLKYRHEMSGGRYLQPHVRWYRQSASDHFRPWLLDGEALPEFATADYRLGEMDTWTIGIKHGRPIGASRSISVRLEYYLQSPSAPDSAPGQLADVELFPKVKAVFAQVGFTTEF